MYPLGRYRLKSNFSRFTFVNSAEKMKSFIEMPDKIQEYFESKNVERVILFGSFARGTATKKSDIDLIIIMDTPKKFFNRYDDFDELYNIAGNSLDMLIYTAAEWERIKDRHFFKKILTEGKTIYVSGKKSA